MPPQPSIPQPQQMQPQMPAPAPRSHSGTILSIIFVLIVVGGGALYLWMFGFPSMNPLQPKSPWGTYETVQKNNQDFSDGEALLAQKKYAEAEAKFISALPGARSAEEEAEISYKVAQAVASSGDYMRAVILYKEIAENTFYPRIVRAYAIQNMGQLYARYGDSKITESIFSTEPYKTVRAASDDSLSYRLLYEYSVALFPLATAELMIADWYAKELLAAHDSGTALSADTQEKYKKAIRDGLALADADITRITDSPEQVSLPAMLARKAYVIARMQIMGDTSFGDATTIFEQSLNLARATNTQYQDGYTRYFYGVFLARTGKGGNVPTVLMPLYTDAGYKGTAAERFFVNEKKNILHSKANVVLLAKNDPQFKAYLISLGWTAADFK